MVIEFTPFIYAIPVAIALFSKSSRHPSTAKPPQRRRPSIRIDYGQQQQIIALEHGRNHDEDRRLTSPPRIRRSSAVTVPIVISEPSMEYSLEEASAFLQPWEKPKVKLHFISSYHPNHSLLSCTIRWIPFLQKKKSFCSRLDVYAPTYSFHGFRTRPFTWLESIKSLIEIPDSFSKHWNSQVVLYRRLFASSANERSIVINNQVQWLNPRMKSRYKTLEEPSYVEAESKVEKLLTNGILTVKLKGRILFSPWKLKLCFSFLLSLFLNVIFVNKKKMERLRCFAYHELVAVHRKETSLL